MKTRRFIALFLALLLLGSLAGCKKEPEETDAGKSLFEIDKNAAVNQWEANSITKEQKERISQLGGTPIDFKLALEVSCKGSIGAISNWDFIKSTEELLEAIQRQPVYQSNLSEYEKLLNIDFEKYVLLVCSWGYESYEQLDGEASLLSLVWVKNRLVFVFNSNYEGGPLRSDSNSYTKRYSFVLVRKTDWPCEEKMPALAATACNVRCGKNARSLPEVPGVNGLEYDPETHSARQGLA